MASTVPVQSASRTRAVTCGADMYPDADLDGLPHYVFASGEGEGYTLSPPWDEEPGNFRAMNARIDRRR